MQTFLVFAGPDDSRMALPLGMVARLEEFPAADVEKSGGEWVIQYRGKILPLIRLDVVLEERRTRLRHGNKAVAPDPLQVLVCNDEGRTLGIVVRTNSGHRGGPGGSEIPRRTGRHYLRGGDQRPGDGAHRCSGPAANRRGQPHALQRNTRRSLTDPWRKPDQFCTFYLDKLMFGVELEKVAGSHPLPGNYGDSSGSEGRQRSHESARADCHRD